ncbi:hypothetical protein DPX16_1897 [Anabarilius grahami]|uniref:Uncharacterized protein n=1 Tax=Anabarilius grahami TaxID=495550 RepID=A0A3N0YRW6_ANAGA|nr:hypothetical protein DPX16_1897 [Anabarilius grahami]
MFCLSVSSRIIIMQCILFMSWFGTMSVFTVAFKYLLELSVSPPQITDLLLQSLQLPFSSTHCSLFLIRCVTSERLNSAKILSLSSTAAFEERC